MYGTNIETSDKDRRGFFLPTCEEALGFRQGPDSVVTNSKEKDEAYWEIRHFFKLCAQANPNVLEVLFAPEDCIEVCGVIGETVRDYRSGFLSRRIARTYLGYATGNYKRLLKMDPYDGKDAMHMIRLVRMGAEALTTGFLRVRRTEDREFFLAIRRCEVPWERLQQEFEGHQKLWSKMEADSVLPAEPDEKFLSGLCSKLVLQRINAERFIAPF